MEAVAHNHRDSEFDTHIRETSTVQRRCSTTIRRTEGRRRWI